MYLVDTHSHIYLEHFDDDRDEVIHRAQENGVRQILLPNIDSGSIPQMISLQEQYPEVCFLMMGLHPTSVRENWEDEISQIEKCLDKVECVAVGEIGIDLYWDKTFIEEQKKAFTYQIELATKKDLPFIIHSRESFPEVFEVLESMDRKFKGVFHAFSGTVEDAERAISLGFKLGIGGVVTFKRAGLDLTLSHIGVEHLVLETDAPYLTPVPFRGKRNESSYVRFVAEKIAEISQLSLDEVAHITSKNARDLFRLPHLEF